MSSPGTSRLIDPGRRLGRVSVPPLNAFREEDFCMAGNGDAADFGDFNSKPGYKYVEEQPVSGGRTGRISALRAAHRFKPSMRRTRESPSTDSTTRAGDRAASADPSEKRPQARADPGTTLGSRSDSIKPFCIAHVRSRAESGDGRQRSRCSVCGVICVDDGLPERGRPVNLPKRSSCG